MNLATSAVTKGDFAAMLNVSAGRVSQYIAEGKIFGPALNGEGRRATINPDIAKQQLRQTLEPSQRFGANGAALNRIETPSEPSQTLFSPRPAPVSTSAPPLAPQDVPVDELAQLRLQRERIKTAQAQREEQLELGRYVLAEESRRETAKAVNSAFAVMDQGLRQMSEMLSEQFSLPQQDLQHALVKAFRSVRQAAAADFRRQAEETPDMIKDPAP